MKIRMIALAALAFSAACGGTAPGEGPSPDGGGGGGAMAMGPRTGGGGPSVPALLGARERLALTGPQVTALDSIGRAWSMRNDTLQRRLRETWGGTRPRGAESMERARPILMAIAENNADSNTAVETLLTAEQRTTACAVQDEQAGGRGDARRRPAGGRPGARRPGTLRDGDTIPGMMARRGWPWCSAPAAP